MSKRSVIRRLVRTGSAAAALAAAGDFPGLGRRLRELATGARPPLPADLEPAHRDGAPRQSRGVRLIMIGPALERSGAPLSQFELACGLAARGWRVLTLAAGDGPLGSAYRDAGLDLEVWPWLRADPAVPAWYERDVAALAGRLQGLEAGVVYANTLDLFPAVDAAHLAGLPSVWNIREGEPWRVRLADRHPAIAARALAAFAYPDAVVHVAAATRLAWQGFTPAARAHVIYNAPATAEAHRPSRPRAAEDADAFRILSVGTLCPRKGQLDLIAAHARLPEDVLHRTRIAFAGRAEGSYADKMRAAIKQGCAQFVTFLGEVDDIAARLLEADALVHCAHAEAFPRVFLEAASAGAPIIASRTGGAAERLHDGVSALLFEAGDADALAACITQLARDCNLGLSLARGAQRDLVSGWTRTEMIDAYERLFEKALTGANGKA